MGLQDTLYIVATPIGHRDDLSMRAVETLRSVSRIYAEDTRHSLKLLRHHGIDTPLRALHEHNESAEAVRLVTYVKEHGSAALITDAGTPLISDPGYRVVRACREAGVKVSPIPGPCAVSAALSVAGLPTDRFQFVGFPPAKSTARRRWLDELAHLPHTLVLYESPHRILACLDDLATSLGGEREITLARELTKRFETVLNGDIDAVRAQLSADPNQQRGEFVLVVAGHDADERAAPALAIGLDVVIRSLLPHLSSKDVARICVDLCGVTRREAYARVLELKDTAGDPSPGS